MEAQLKQLRKTTGKQVKPVHMDGKTDGWLRGWVVVNSQQLKYRDGPKTKNISLFYICQGLTLEWRISSYIYHILPQYPPLPPTVRLLIPGSHSSMRKSPWIPPLLPSQGNIVTPANGPATLQHRW